MRLKALTAALIGLSVLCLAGCGSTRQASERLRVEGLELRELEARDSLREEISQNLNENLAEHEVVTWTVTGLPLTAYGLQEGDTLKVERVTERTRTLDSGSKIQDSRVVERTEVVRDTVYIEHRDTVEVQKLQGTSSSLNPHPSALNYLKWIFALICAITVLIITAKLCLHR